MRKTLSLIISLSFAFSVSAGSNSDKNSPNNQSMQQMMENAQKMADCMRNIDEKESKRFRKLSKNFEKKIKSLCKKGDIKAAEAEVLQYSEKVNNDPYMIKVRQCSADMAEGMIQDFAKDKKRDPNSENKNVCSGF